MFVAAYDGGSGGGAPSNSLLCWFEKIKESKKRQNDGLV